MMQWNLITVGQLSRNRFWNESEETPCRDVLCTCTLIKTGDHNIVVDPSRAKQDMAQSLFDASGLAPRDIDIVYLTHLHADHAVGLDVFPNARWFMAEADLKIQLRDADTDAKARLRRVRPAVDALCAGVEVVALPGHTPGLAGLLFTAPEGRVLVAGDCVMTKDFFSARLPYYFCADEAQNRQSIEKAAALADVIIPGHGNYFITAAYPKNEVAP
jgi:glyoxylase-like metal-dependent hydrolase (beta-lactamase superfamily II)